MPVRDQLLKAYWFAGVVTGGCGGLAVGLTADSWSAHPSTVSAGGEGERGVVGAVVEKVQGLGACDHVDARWPTGCLWLGGWEPVDIYADGGKPWL
jgi:hypothetical protein